jgi:hypothetical protein
LGCDCKRHQRTVGESAQSTVEFALVTAAFLAVTLGLGALMRFASGGDLMYHALICASHHIQMVAPTTLVDVFLY